MEWIMIKKKRLAFRRMLRLKGMVVKAKEFEFRLQ